MANLNLMTKYVEDNRRFQELSFAAGIEHIDAKNDLSNTKDGYWCTVNRDKLSIWVKNNSARIQTDDRNIIVSGHDTDTATFYMAPIENNKMLILIR